VGEVVDPPLTPPTIFDIKTISFLFNVSLKKLKIMIEISRFKSLVGTNADGSKRTELAAQPLATGDVLKLTDAEEREVNGVPFVALTTADGQMLSANSVLRRGNGISFGTNNLDEAADKLFNAVGSENGLTLTIAKVYRSESATGIRRNNYRFNAIEL